MLLQSLYFSRPPPPTPPARAIIPDDRPLGTFENQDIRDGKTRYIYSISRKNSGLCMNSLMVAFIATIYRGTESFPHALSHRRSRQRHKILLPKLAAQTGTAHCCLTHYINRFGHSKVFGTAGILIFKVSIKALEEKSLPKSYSGCFILLFVR